MSRGPRPCRTIREGHPATEGDDTAAARVLIVEDHRFFSEALRMLLGRLSEEHGLAAEFRAVATVAEGLGIARAGGPFDVAIVDLMPPDRHRTDVVREIKASYPETLVAVPSGVRDLSGALRAGPTRPSARRSRARYGVSSVSNTICGRRLT